jgi:DNA-binding ferritin-like protein
MKLMDKCIKMCALYVATLKAISLIHQQNHWLTNGDTFFGNHLLFERIYKSSLEDLDSAAEKFIGAFGDSCLDYDLQTDLLHGVLSKYKNLEGSPQHMSLAIEKAFLKLSQDLSKLLEDEDKLSLGIADLIGAIADSRETSVYLLQQSLKQE